jgi:hypothetical protein
MAKTFTSRFDTYEAVERLHRGKPFKDLVNSKTWKRFIIDNLTSFTYKIAFVPAEMENRADLISQAAYGTDRLWWVICSANGVIDPMTELVAGKELKIPIIQ